MPTPLPLPDDSPFGLAALPYGVAQVDGERHVVVRWGDHAVSLARLAAAGGLDGVDPDLLRGPLDRLLAAGPATWRAVRDRVVALFGGDGPALDEDTWTAAAAHVDAAELVLPFTVADYVDFYCSINHATNVGRLFRPDDDPLLPNRRHQPNGYHRRSSTVVVSGVDVRRPHGLRPGDDGPTFGPSRRLDVELEVGMVVGRGNALGEPIAVDAAAEHVFGLCLVNDWSARDVQAYEYKPLGPFLGKSFLTSVSPWIVPLPALEPALTTPPTQEPTPAAYLRATRDWAVPIDLEVLLETPAMREAGEPPAVVARTGFADMYWTFAQMLAHMTVNGAVTRPGDLFASGTVSGDQKGTYGSLLELSWAGREPLELPGGETRTFLEDGDRAVLRGVTTLPSGERVGFGEVSGTVLPATPRPDASP